MSKEKNDLFVVILFSILWIVRPISYDEMRSRHPIYPQENVVVVNSSSILNQNDEFDFLESTTKEVILAKESRNSFFTQGFQTPLPQRTGSQTATGMSGSNPGSGGGGSNPGSGASESCPATPTLKSTPEVIDHHPTLQQKKKKDQCPLSPIGEPSKGPSSEMIINSDFQDKKILITDKDVKRCMSEKDRKRSDDQGFNEKIYKNEIGIRVSNPDEVYTKNYRGEPATIYVEKSKTGDSEIIAAIVDNKSGRLKLNSPLTSEEYRDLINQKNMDLELTDLRRDPETGVINSKSIAEYFTIERAKEQGVIKGKVRRPKTYLGEKNTDFIDLSGSKKYELKKVVQNKYKSYQDSAKDIIKNIRINSQNTKVGEKLPDYIIDLEEVPNSLKQNIAQNIQDQLQSINNLNELNFLY